jgi:hypothetical protein
MTVVFRRVLILALGVALAGCAAESATNQARHEAPSPKTSGQSQKSAAIAKSETTPSIGAGNYVASLEGMT